MALVVGICIMTLVVGICIKYMHQSHEILLGLLGLHHLPPTYLHEWLFTYLNAGKVNIPHNIDLSGKDQMSSEAVVHVWNAGKPLISDKTPKHGNIILLDNDYMVGDANQVCQTLNEYFVNISKPIGQPDGLTECEDIDDILEEKTLQS